MTALSIADIPQTITTLEGLSIWCSTVLNHLNFDNYLMEEGRNREIAAVHSIHQVNIETAPTNYYSIGRVIIPLTDDYRLYSRPWEAGAHLELTATPIPTALKN